MPPKTEAELARERARMVDEIEVEVRETRKWTGRDRLSPRVIAAMAKIPRHRFLAPADVAYAYLNRPWTIGFGQTISQPYIVALMTELLDLEPDGRVLEIGTGSGYQTAVLAEIAFRVYSIEAVETLAERARARLSELGYRTIQVRAGDGHEGWPELAPFDAVIVTAAAERAPPALVAQLGPGGRLVIPVGRPYESQTLVRAVKNDDGTLASENVLPVAFVPMVSKGNEPR
ncbi:MAG: protein-L-isoaspartate(D-aspartate) O-methyltransferase [Rhodospirillales bacterium]|nr:protein-L-isoaspartate(D-aspartate) O-methyltransferase [Rhodospirillales bacterium]